jgi:hypothetical protein
MLMQTQVSTFCNSSFRLMPLAMAVIVAIGYDAPAIASPAATIVVQNCNDHGTGSLRAAVASAANGSTIDLSQLSCAGISLTTGAVTISQSSLTLSGPGADSLTIDGGASNQHYNRILKHTGTGQLSISGLTLTGAKYKPSAAETLGGCVYSKGALVVTGSTISTCLAIASGTFDAVGGAIWAANGLVLLNSDVTGSLADATGAGSARGGGIYCHGDLTIKYSTISDNIAIAATSTVAEGGGVEAIAGDVVMFSSTVANNYAGQSEGGLLFAHSTGDPPNTARIINSTISGNRAAHGVGGLRSTDALTLANTTIAFNDSGTASGLGAGVQLQAPLNLQSSIIAENYGDSGDDDLYTGSQTVTGADNLVTQHSGTSALPGDTITACPLLGRLSNNGGLTLTHRLLPNSPALDAGNNNTGFGGDPLEFDQRGDGHTRAHNGLTDIGAFEYAGGTADEIFRSGFEGRCR